MGQVVSLKMVTDPEGVVDRINDHLPPQLRVCQPRLHARASLPNLTTIALT